MDRGLVGRNFHAMVLDMAENYALVKSDGETYTGKLSVVAKTASTYMLGEREYLMTGVATFPDVESQTAFRGCYFKRDANPKSNYILVSTIPKDTTPYVAEVYAIGCNTTIKLAILKETFDENGDRVLTPEVYAENVLVYCDSTLQKQRRSSDGNLDQTLYFMQIPAKFGIAQDHVVFRNMFQYNPETNRAEMLEVRFRVEAVDPSMMSVDADGNICGIFDVQMSIDTRD